MFYRFVTRPGSNIKVGLHAKGPPSNPEMYAKYDGKVWIEGGDLLTRLAIHFLSSDERQAIAKSTRDDAEMMAKNRI